MAKPIIRFKGYQDDWEQRKLENFGKATGGTSIESEFSEDGIYKVISIGSYSENSVYNDQGIRAIKSDKTSNRVLNKNDLTMILNDKTTSGNIIGRVLLIEKSGIYVYNQRTERIEININEYDPVFLYEMFNAPNIREKIIKQAQGNTQIYVNWSTIAMLDYMIPSKKEQVKIGQFLHSISNLITLHQRKCDETKKLKKYMLQKMFPQNGEKVPEIRFSGFTDDWEQRKLEDIAEFSKGSGYSKGDLIESGTPIILYGRLYTKYETSISEVDTYVEAKDGSVYSKGGEVIVPASGETAEDIARAATVDKSGVILGGDLNVVSPNEDINSAFLAISISHGNSQRELAKKAQGKSVVHIHNEEIKNLVVPFPANAEQNKIVEYFSNLDHLITLHQRKSCWLAYGSHFRLGTA